MLILHGAGSSRHKGSQTGRASAGRLRVLDGQPERRALGQRLEEGALGRRPALGAVQRHRLPRAARSATHPSNPPAIVIVMNGPLPSPTIVVMGHCHCHRLPPQLFVKQECLLLVARLGLGALRTTRARRPRAKVSDAARGFDTATSARVTCCCRLADAHPGAVRSRRRARHRAVTHSALPRLSEARLRPPGGPARATENGRFWS